MYKDEIIEEVWKNRDEYTKKKHHNLNEILADLQKRQNLSNHQFIDRCHLRKQSKQTKAA
jgi:hypothetical protein